MPLSLATIRSTFDALTKPTIIVADDVDVFRNLLCARLRQDGFQVLEARNAAELFAHINRATGDTPEHQLDLVISTTCLIGQTGIGLLLGIHAKRREIPLVLLDRVEHRTTQIFTHRAGGSNLDCLPLSLDVIRQVANQLISGEAVTGAPDSTTIRTAKAQGNDCQDIDGTPL
jgi:DNA-binding NtrC family response regulator